jgi:hypothetical protein
MRNTLLACKNMIPEVEQLESFHKVHKPAGHSSRIESHFQDLDFLGMGNHAAKDTEIREKATDAFEITLHTGNLHAQTESKTGGTIPDVTDRLSRSELKGRHGCLSLESWTHVAVTKTTASAIVSLNWSRHVKKNLHSRLTAQYTRRRLDG